MRRIDLVTTPRPLGTRRRTKQLEYCQLRRFPDSVWSRLLSYIRMYKVKDICRGQHKLTDVIESLLWGGHKWIQLLVIMSVMVMTMMMLIQAINAFYKWRLQFLISYLSMPMTLMRRRLTMIMLMTVTCECIDMNGDNMVDALPPVALGQLLHRLLASF